MRASTLCLAIAIAVVAVAPRARADTSATSTVAQLMVLEPGDASYKLFHGAVWLEIDKATVNYRWGGLECKGRDLGDTSIQLLYAAFRGSDQVSLEYVVTRYRNKQYRCVTGFTLSKR